MKVSELYQYLDERIPRSLSCEWDNDGLMCCPDADREVKRVLLALDITEDVVDAAVVGRYDVIVSHHPLVFRPVKALNGETGVQRKLIKLIQNNIAAMSFHTRLDAVDGGVNDILAKMLALDDIAPFGPEGEKMGRIGTIPAPLSLDIFAKYVGRILGTPAVLYSGAKTVRHVAVLGGNGDDFIDAAIEAGADTLVSGRLGYHPMTDAKECGINLIEAGHYYTERPVLSALSDMIGSADTAIETVIVDSNSISCCCNEHFEE
jgi:dinuclear metal center YbgI/SA1388 family protein